MRTIIAVICYGLALAFVLGALALIGWGIQINSAAEASQNGLAMGALFSAATFRVALGCAALIGGVAFAVAGGRAQRVD